MALLSLASLRALATDAYWLAFKAFKAIATPVVVNPVTDLALIHATDGQQAYISSRRAYADFLEASTATVDNVWVFAAFGGVGRWHRQADIMNAWANTAVWNVDPSTGNNNNDGTSAPLASMAELAARINGVTLLGSANLVTINITGAVDAARVRTILGDGVSMTIHGVRTTLSTGTVTASNTAVVATNTPARITDAAVVAWTTGQIIQSPPTTGNLAWIDADLGVGQARTSTAMTPLGNGAGGLGATYAVLGLPTMPLAEFNVQCELSTSPASSQQVHFEGIEFTRAGSNDFDLSISAQCRVRLSECKADAPMSISGQFTSSSGVAVLISNCWFAQGYTVDGSKGTHAFQGGALHATGGTALNLSSGANVQVQNAQVLASSSTTGVFLATGSALSFTNAGLGAFDNTSDAFLIRPGAALLVGGGATAIAWGNGNTGMGMRINANGHADYAAAQIHTVTGTAGDFRCGQAALSLTTINTTVSPTTTITADQTWANVTGAFGGSILHPQTGASLTSI